MLLMAQTPPAQVAAADPGVQITQMEKAQQWPALADFFETLTPKQRGAHLESWLRAMQKAGRWPRLLQVCEEVIPQLESKSGPSLSLARLERAQALSGLNHHGDAELAHEQNGKLGYPPGFQNACVEAQNAQDWPGLERCAGEILASAPSNAQALAWKGEGMGRQERYQEAEPVLRQAIQGDPNQAMTWNNLGRCLNARQAWQESMEALNKAIDLDPNQWEAHYNRGLAEFHLGSYDASLQDLKTAQTANPSDPEIRDNLAKVEAYVHPAKAGHKPKTH